MARIITGTPLMTNPYICSIFQNHNIYVDYELISSGKRQQSVKYYKKYADYAKNVEL